MKKKPSKSRPGGLKTLLDHAVNTGIEDLAEQHDHYIYGTPKRKPAKRRPPAQSRPRKKK